MNLARAILRHKGKAGASVLAAVLLLAVGRGCRVNLEFDPVRAREATNAAPADPTP